MDAEHVRWLWRDFPGPLVCIPTGAVSGFAVLDVDPDHGGCDWLHKQFDRLPRTRVHETRSGGFHLLFRHKPGLRNSAGKIAPGVDVRADGGYVIWWPAAGLPVPVDVPLAPWPEWLDWLLPEPEPSAPTARRDHDPGRPVRIMGDSALAAVLRTAAEAPEGQRNAIAFWAACRLGEQVRIGMLDAAEAVELVADAARQAGLPNAEAYSTARSGVGKTS